MTDVANDYVPGLAVNEVKHTIVANANPPAIAVFKFLGAARRRVVFQGKDGLCDAGLNLLGKNGQFLAGVAGDVYLPIHTRMLSSFNT